MSNQADPIKLRPCTALPTTIVLLRRRGSTTATAEATTGELGVEATRGTTLLLLAILTAAVATLAVATGATTSTTTALAVTTEHAARGSVRALLLDVGLGDDLGGEVQPLAEVVKTLGGEGVVVPLPGELGLEVAAGSQGLASLDDLEEESQHCAQFWYDLSRRITYVEVLGVNVTVLGLVEVLLGDEHTLAEEVLVDRLAVGLGNQPGALSVIARFWRYFAGGAHILAALTVWLVWLVGGLDKVVVVQSSPAQV